MELVRTPTRSGGGLWRVDLRYGVSTRLLLFAVGCEIAGVNARFVAPGNADALAEAMTHTGETSHAPQAIAARRAWARESSREACVARTVCVYEELV